MKTNLIVACSLLLLLITGDRVFSQVTGKGAFPYLIAYNIHVPDTSKDDWEVMIMNMDGTGQRNLTNHPDVAWTYYAYENRLFFISDRDTCYRCYFLYEMKPDGSGVKKVSNLRMEDSWMSARNNGTEMIVAGREDKIRHQLYLLNTLTGEYHRLTNDTVARYGDPCFSPDGKQIVFSYRKNKRDRESHEELYVMDADGSNMMQITTYPEDNVSAKEYGYKAGAARWHPSGEFITYVSRQDGRNSIFAVTPHGQKQWKLTGNAFGEGWHDWSADGEWLVFNSTDKGEKQYHINLMNYRTKEQKQLTGKTYKTQQAPVFVKP